MFLIRASLLWMVVVVSMARCDGVGEDRIGTLLSMMADMGNHVNSLTESVKNIYRMEEETAEHMVKTEDRVGNIDSQIAQMKTQMGQLEKKVNDVDTDVVTSVLTSWMNPHWKLIGHGYQGSCGHQVGKLHTTLQECVTFCTQKRQESGPAWNGFNWNQSGDQHCTCNEYDVGHSEDADFLHFKIQ